MDRNTQDEDAEMIVMLERVLKLEKERELAVGVERREQHLQFTKLSFREIKKV